MSNKYIPTTWVGSKTVATANVMNNMEKGISDAHDRLDGVDEQFNTINNNVELLNNIKVNYNDLKIFKPIFGFNCLGSSSSDCTDFESQKILIDKMVNIGVNTFSYCVFIKENEDGTMSFNEDLDLISKCIEYCKSNNLNINKIHVYVKQEFNTVTSNFNSQYKSMISQILEIFNNVDYEYFVVWNEATSRIINNVVKSTVLECIDIVKNKGKKVGIALQGVSPFGYLDDTLFANSDFICFNHYNYISYKYEKTTIEDGINSWKQGNLVDIINYAKNKYSDKDIIIGESGIVGSWECLFNPASVPKSGKTYDTTGKVLEIYYTGLLECLKNSDVKYVYGWFPHDFVANEKTMKKLFNKYLNGGKKYD